MSAGLAAPPRFAACRVGCPLKTDSDGSIDREVSSGITALIITASSGSARLRPPSRGEFLRGARQRLEALVWLGPCRSVSCDWRACVRHVWPDASVRVRVTARPGEAIGMIVVLHIFRIASHTVTRG